MEFYPELCLDRHKVDFEREKEAITLLRTGIFYSLDVTLGMNYWVLITLLKYTKKQPISKFVYANIPVSICSDNILTFDSCVSGEYLKLYKNGVLSECELNKIRILGLEFYQN